MCSHHNGIKREINDRKIREKSPNTWKLNNTFPNNPWVNEEVSREIKKKDTLNQMQTKCNILKFVGHSQTVLKWKFIAVMHKLEKRKRLKSISSSHFKNPGGKK